MSEPAHQPDPRLADMPEWQEAVGEWAQRKIDRLEAELAAREQQLQDKTDELYDVERERDAAWQRLKRSEQQLASLREALRQGAEHGETEALRAWCRLILIEDDVDAERAAAGDQQESGSV